MQRCMLGQQPGKLRTLLVVGQLAVDDQIGGFNKGGFLRQLFDGIAAVAQNTYLAVDVGDTAGA